jgi:hypothetical protein
MAVRRNIGGISKAIGKGIKAAYYSIPSFVKDPTLYSTYYNAGNWSNTDTFPDAFIIGIHKWGDTTKKVREIRAKK